MSKLFPVITRGMSHVCNLKPFKQTKWLMPNGNPIGAYVYNCVANEKVPVILNDPHIATWYSCGPTVYDSAHVGHASCYVKLDIIQRILKSVFNVRLITAMGITDIDDKIIKKALDKETHFTNIAKQYEHEFWVDMASLNIEKPHIITRVSEHMENVQDFVKHLIDSDKAYVTSDGSVYFDTSKFPAYGKLQKTQPDGEPANEGKRNKMDFALWKGKKAEEPYWETPWGEGRPGWHVECSAMVSKLFGSQIDFHAGGIDLQFPHHENEEAQSCSFHNNRQWVNYWIHVGHLQMKGDVKMSKSLQNTISVPELLEKHSADVFRMACLTSHYRNTMEYNDEMMKTAEDILNKFKFFLRDASNYVNGKIPSEGIDDNKLIRVLERVEENNMAALKFDFNTATCISNLQLLVSEANRIIKLNQTDYYPIPIILTADYISNMLNTFGLRIQEQQMDVVSDCIVDTLVEFRNIVRSCALKSKDSEILQACDMVRDKLKRQNLQINDTQQGSSWITVK